MVYLVLELAENGELYDYIMEKPFSERLAIFFIKKILEAIDYCHTKGFAHRDPKAMNILVNALFDIKIGDFGASNFIHGSDGSGLCSSLVGTIGHLPPEIEEWLQ